MPKLSANQIAGYLKAAGFSQNQLATGVAIVLAESGGDTDVIGPLPSGKNTNGTSDYGLMQINSIHNPTAQNWRDPLVNARMGKAIYDAAGGWKPWSTFNNGAYRFHWAEALRGAANPDTSDLGSDARAGGMASDGEFVSTQQYNDGPNFGDMISNPETWWRVGYFVAGLTFLVLAAGKMLAKTDVGSAAVGVVTKGLVKTK